MQTKYLENKRVSLIFFVYIWIMWAALSITKSCFSAAMATIVHDGVMTKSQTGLILAAFYFVYAPFQILGGKLADRYSSEKLILIGFFGAFVCNLLIYLNQNFYVMLFVWSLNAAIQFGIWPAIFKIISSQLAVVHRKMGMFWISFSLTFGLLLAYIIAMFVKRWEFNFLISAILLLIFALGFWVLCRWVKKYMVPYEVVVLGESENGKTVNIAAPVCEEKSSVIFQKSGFYFMIPVFVFYSTVLNTLKTLTSTMLMESYDNVSPVIGNFLNLFVIMAGIAGPIIVKFLLYPRIIKDEVKGMIAVLLLALPFLAALLGLGKIKILLLVAPVCVAVMIYSMISLIRTYFTMKYSKFGCEGEAAGLINAGDSLGYTVQNYGITFAAEHIGWGGVSWIVMVLGVVSVAIMGAMLPIWRKFVKKYQL